MNTTLSTDKPFNVTLWGSHPDQGADDCWTGDDFASREEAQAAYEDPARMGAYVAASLADSAYIVLAETTKIEGGVREMEILAVRPNPSFKPRRRSARDDDWRQEIATQAGMGGGIDAYNEVRGQ